MRFIRDLILWFVRGTEVESVAEGPKLEPIKKNTPKKDDFDIFKPFDPHQIMKDLKAIEPMSRQLYRAKREVVEELKRMGSQPSHKPSNFQ
jgi:hypothetical protein